MAASGAAPAADGGAAAAPTAALSGEALYNKACVACHAAGVAGAPKFGDKAAWGPRIGLGLEALTASAACGNAPVAIVAGQGWHPGVLSRGYGAAQRPRPESPLLVRADGKPPDACQTGDEPVLIWRRQRVPMAIASDRVAGGRALLQQHPDIDILVCDDGLQHLALGRDLSIAVFDERGSGNGWQLPAGLLREPWPPAPGDPFAPDLLLRQRRDEVAGAPLKAFVP